MDLIPSVSRSSGLEDRGDVLKEPKVQEEYRIFIESKLQHYWSHYPVASHLTGQSSDSQRNLQSNILILFRKLREGLMASKRVDDFALEVYETSFHLSVLFRTPAQTTSIMNQLIPKGHGIYDAHIEVSASHETKLALYSSPMTSNRLSLKQSRPLSSYRRERQPYRPPHVRREQVSDPSSTSRARSPVRSERQKSHLQSNIMSTALISFLHILVQSYPLQSSYHSTFCSFQQSQLGQGGDTANQTFKWLKSIATAMASRNYVRFERLSRSNEVDGLCHRLGSPETHGRGSHLEMRYIALRCLVEDLRTKVRGTVWEVLTVAYRELDATRSADWLLQSLMINLDLKAGDLAAPPSVCQSAESWLEQRGEMEARRKEGAKGCWILCRRHV